MTTPPNPGSVGNEADKKTSALFDGLVLQQTNPGPDETLRPRVR
ncbi:MAG: hypothetical protein ACYDC1_16880 [Limisphaerales bacterium]